jgi:hypothetical protein
MRNGSDSTALRPGALSSSRTLPPCTRVTPERTLAAGRAGSATHYLRRRHSRIDGHRPLHGLFLPNVRGEAADMPYV